MLSMRPSVCAHDVIGQNNGVSTLWVKWQHGSDEQSLMRKVIVTE